MQLSIGEPTSIVSLYCSVDARFYCVFLPICLLTAPTDSPPSSLFCVVLLMHRYVRRCDFHIAISTLCWSLHGAATAHSPCLPVSAVAISAVMPICTTTIPSTLSIPFQSIRLYQLPTPSFTSNTTTIDFIIARPGVSHHYYHTSRVIIRSIPSVLFDTISSCLHAPTSHHCRHHIFIPSFTHHSTPSTPYLHASMHPHHITVDTTPSCPPSPTTSPHRHHIFMPSRTHITPPSTPHLHAFMHSHRTTDLVDLTSKSMPLFLVHTLNHRTGWQASRGAAPSHHPSLLLRYFDLECSLVDVWNGQISRFRELEEGIRGIRDSSRSGSAEMLSKKVVRRHTQNFFARTTENVRNC